MNSRVDPFAKQDMRFSTMLVVRDVDVSAAFYTRHFGFRISQAFDGLRQLERAGVSLYVVAESEPTADKPGVTLACLPERARPPVNLIFHVDDVRAVHAALAGSGLAFLAPPQSPAWGGWRCFAQDPDGYLIEIEQAGN